MMPDFQSIMLPLLEICADKKEHDIPDLIQQICDKFKLSNEERTELLPSGNQLVINNRVGGARSYLRKAGLLHFNLARRATFSITEKGLEVLASKPKHIDIKYLKQLHNFQDWGKSRNIFVRVFIFSILS